jgi:hypothetical protein
MPTLKVELSEVLHTSVLEIVSGRFASVDWFIERALLDKVSEVRTEQAAPPRLRASAYRIAGAIVLTAGLRVVVRERDASGEVIPDGAVSSHELLLKETIRTIPDGDSDTVLGNALMKILAASSRDTAAFGKDAVEAGRALLRKAVGVSSELALWKTSDRVSVELESVADITGEIGPSRISFSPMVKPSQHNWLNTKTIPELVVNMIAPRQLGQALRRSFVFCDMDP